MVDKVYHFTDITKCDIHKFILFFYVHNYTTDSVVTLLILFLQFHDDLDKLKQTTEQIK